MIVAHYTEEQIKARAVEFMNYRRAGDHRCALMLMMLSIATGVSQEECVARIARLAGEE